MLTSPDQSAFLVVDRDIEAILQANGLTMPQVLASAGVVGLEPVRDPGALQGTREVVMIMMASAAIIAAATPLIVNTFKTMTQRPVVVKELELTALLDGNGQAVKGANGEPVLSWREKSVLLEPKQQNAPAAEVKAYGFEIKLG